MNRAALYYRVSTAEQTVDSQMDELRSYAERRGLDIVGEYIDEGVSGAARSRPELDRMTGEVKDGRVDVVVCWSFDRLARSVRHLCELAEELETRNVDLISLKEQLDTGTPSGRLTFHVLAAISEFERDMLRERVKAGMAAAKARGRRLGRRRIPPSKQFKAQALREQRLSYAKIAVELGISPATAFKYCQRRP